MRKTELLDKYARDGDSRLLLARVLDQWQRAEQRGVPTHTGFLSPAEQAVSADLLMAAAPGQGILAGGYPDAERRLWAFLPDWLEEETWQQGEECPLCALEVETPPGAGLTHRDYLGSLMGLGLTREKLGDILLSQQGAQVVVLREVLPILLSQWEKVGRYPVRLTPIPLAQLRPVPGERKQIRATVASLHSPEPGRRADPGRPGDGEPPALRQSRQGCGGRGCAHLPGPGKVCAAGDRRHLQAGQDHFGAGTVFVKERDRNPLRAEKPARGREVP